ncbi:MAG: hypothetical protein QM765_10555 [Myxococcales bacterium]
MGWNERDGATERVSMGDEVAAASALAKKAASTRAFIVLPGLVASAIVGLGVTVVVSGIASGEFELATRWKLAATFGLPFVAGGFLSAKTAGVVVRRRGKAWAEEIARRYGVSRATLEDITQYWD